MINVRAIVQNRAKSEPAPNGKNAGENANDRDFARLSFARVSTCKWGERYERFLYSAHLFPLAVSPRLRTVNPPSTEKNDRETRRRPSPSTIAIPRGCTSRVTRGSKKIVYTRDISLSLPPPSPSFFIRDSPQITKDALLPMALLIVDSKRLFTSVG